MRHIIRQIWTVRAPYAPYLDMSHLDGEFEDFLRNMANIIQEIELVFMVEIKVVGFLSLQIFNIF